MTTDTDRTENDAVIEAIRNETLVQHRELDPGYLGESIRPAGTIRELIDLELYDSAPRRSVGTSRVHDADGFTTAVMQRRLDDALDAVRPDWSPVLYADETTRQLVAVLNDDHGVQSGWRDYRVQLELRRTPEWTHWTEHQGLKTQEAFADAIEEGVPEITDPDPATMLELAQTFQATTSARFQRAGEIRTGRQTLVWQEDVDATAGRDPGSIVIPEEFTITVRPFIGFDPWQVKARLRFRLPRSSSADGFKIGYDLVRPDDVERAAFSATVDTVAAGIESTLLIRGVAPEPRR